MASGCLVDHQFPRLDEDLLHQYRPYRYPPCPAVDRYRHLLGLADHAPGQFPSMGHDADSPGAKFSCVAAIVQAKTKPKAEKMKRQRMLVDVEVGPW